MAATPTPQQYTPTEEDLKRAISDYLNDVR
jgi:hypothetical protein